MEQDISQANRGNEVDVLPLNTQHNLSPRSSSIFDPLSLISFEDGQHHDMSGSASDELSCIARSAAPLPCLSGDYDLATQPVGNAPISSDFIPLLNLHRHASDWPGRHPSVVSDSSRKHRRALTGWRWGVRACASTAAVVFVINTVLTIWVCQTFPMEAGIATLISGECARVRVWAIWLHLAINVSSTILLGASNYTMQRLLAPTRQEVDKAHVNGKWLAIGVLSIRNIKAINLRRLGLFLLLTLTSLPLHLM